MKFLTIWVGLVVSVESASIQPDWSYKFPKWYCNSSGVTMVNPSCYIRSLSRTSQKLSINLEVIKKIEEIDVSLFHYFKSQILICFSKDFLHFFSQNGHKIADN
jgi:hypothetical protein